MLTDRTEDHLEATDNRNRKNELKLKELGENKSGKILLLFS